MPDFVLISDDSCDLPWAYYTENDIEILCLSFHMDGASHTSRDMDPKTFYQHMREGQMPITAQVSVDDWTNAFEPHLKAGRDVLYIGFSSGLSGTCGSGQVAARDLREKYPDRKMIVVDSLCASLGQGLLVHKANNMRKNGASIEEVAQWAEDNKLRVSHMVAVDDLMHLHRGGRISKTSALAGSLLGIKPIIRVDNEGKLVAEGKVRGRKQSIQALVDKMAALMGDTKGDFFTISHSDCEEDAKYLAQLTTQRFGIKDHLIHFIGPVIGAHTGPGTVVLFMMADHR